jgi:transposase InsO family protein
MSLIGKFENNYLRVCATVLVDLYSRRVVGWAMSERIDQQLVLDALNMALSH